MSAAKILLHTCCAPCLISPYYKLREDGYEITAFWYNLNIHPYTEYRKRLDALREFSQKEAIPLIEIDQYGIDEFVTGIDGSIEDRCEFCYRHRLEAVARTAKERGFDAFSTTLLYSRYQKHEMIKAIASEMAMRYEVDFYYEDFRPLWNKGIELSKAAGMYRQQYCGCIFSERDRYLGKPIKESV
ncbi:MAG: hypothetical protein CVU49_00370 [Candidatus Cloacimonetes bacterium HGW-Cloacimonetes-2]|jgi:predicted adenine nucleotide alpha hydrolase (AANH) superfamily ATPase|nr:MAG: hypothetical protein CVU49_00370 [Candidatus Cloacimonetes bacterium HGW-Cloacimonetes-2]